MKSCESIKCFKCQCAWCLHRDVCAYVGLNIVDCIFGFTCQLYHNSTIECSYFSPAFYLSPMFPEEMGEECASANLMSREKEAVQMRSKSTISVYNAMRNAATEARKTHETEPQTRFLIYLGAVDALRHFLGLEVAEMESYLMDAERIAGIEPATGETYGKLLLRLRPFTK